MAGADDTAYTIKDLVLRVEGKVDQLIEAMATKATSAEVDNLKTRVTILETQSKTTQFILFRAAPAALGIGASIAAFLSR